MPTSTVVHRRPLSHGSLRVAGTLALVLGVVLGGCDLGPSAEEHFSKAEEFQRQGDLSAMVIELKNSVQKDPKHARARWMLGQAYLESGNEASAQNELERARDLGFKEPKLEISIARALLLQAKFEDVLAMAKAASDGSQNPEWQILRGEALIATSEPQKAQQAFQQALVLDPGNTDAHRGLAKVGLRGGDTAAADKAIGKALASSNTEVQTWLLKGELELSTGNLDAAEATFSKALELSADNLGAHMGLVRTLLAKNAPDGAASHIEVLVKAAPNDPRVNYLRALLARAQDDVEAARAALLGVLKVAPDHAQSLLLLGQIHFAEQDFARAEAYLGRHVGATPASLAGGLLLGAVQLELQTPAAAIATLKPLEERHPRHPQLLAMLGTAYLSNGEADAGRDYLARAATLAPEAAAIRTQLAVSHLATGGSDAAVTELEAAISADPNFARADVLLILTHLRDRNHEAALQAARQLTQKQPDNPLPFNLLGAVLESQGEIDVARDQYNKALELDIAFKPAALNIARINLVQGRLKEAQAGYKAVLERDPNNPTALVALAKIAGDENRPQESLALLEQARSKNPRAAQPRMILGNYYLRRGQREQAMNVAREARDIAPNNPLVLSLLGRAMLLDGRTEDAIVALLKLVDERPEQAGAHFQLAVAYGQKQDYAGAKTELEQTLELHPGHLLAKVGLGNLALREQDYEAAESVADELLNMFSDSPAGHLLRGGIGYARKDYERAIENYRIGLETAPNSGLLIKLHGATRGLASKRKPPVCCTSGW